jgi:hypothetical protein
MWKTVMPERLSADSTQSMRERSPGADATWSRSAKFALLVWNALPGVYLASLLCGVFWVHGLLVKMILLLAGIYLLPPLVVRILLACRRIEAGSHPLDSPEFLTWWATAQCQVLFCRFPALEEMLRLVPGLYSAWLRLWGAKVGRLTYWSPELRILDRSFLEIGDDVVFGIGVRLNPHVLSDDEMGRPTLHLGSVKVGDDCRIGGYSLLTAGTVVEPNQSLKAFSLSPPWTVWQKGRRTQSAKPAFPR